MVADALIYHPTVAHYLRYMATTLGRDKLMRVLQYFARFYAWYLLRTNGTPDDRPLEHPQEAVRPHAQGVPCWQVC